MADNEPEMQASFKGRKLRLQKIIEEIKKNKKMLVTEVLKFGMNRWLLSSRIIDIYLRELVSSGNFKMSTGPEGDYIEYIGGE